MTARRPIFFAPVRATRRAERISISAPGDFKLGAKTQMPVDEAARRLLLPYCLDPIRRRAVYVGGVDPRGAQAAPFYYLYLRRQAQSIVSIPWESGPLKPDTGRAPIFLFSPGRCGSTLLSRMLFAAGSANVSEPDFYTQATSALVAHDFNPLRAAMRRAAAAMGLDLASALDPTRGPVVKLRAESCRAPRMLLQPSERRTIYLTRAFESWARSNGRAFGNAPHKTVNKYLRAMNCYADLRHSSVCQLLRYEDLRSQPMDAMRDLGRFLGLEIAQEAVSAIMKEDSQAGTPLAQGARPDRPGWEKRFDETMALWNSDRLKRVRDRIDVQELRTG